MRVRKEREGRTTLTTIAEVATILAVIIAAYELFYGPESSQHLTAPSSTSSAASQSFGTVPGVVGEQYLTAEANVTNAGFRAYAKAYPSNYTDEHVFNQDPTGGTRYPLGDVVELDFSAGNRTYAYYTESFWGQGISWGQSGFSVKGQVANLQDLGNRTLYLALQVQPSLGLSGPRFWVQQKPILMTNGTWIGQVSFGLQDLSIGNKFQLLSVITPEQLIPGQTLTALPIDSNIVALQLQLSSIQ